MKKLCASGVVLAGLAVAFPALAAESLKAALTQFGLIGEWAAHCDQPPGKDNGHSHWSADSDTKGTALFDFGRGQTMRYEIDAAQRDDAGHLKLQVVNLDKSTHLALLIEMRDGKTRTVSSASPDGVALIKDGKIVATGADTSWQEHCH